MSLVSLMLPSTKYVAQWTMETLQSLENWQQNILIAAVSMLVLAPLLLWYSGELSQYLLGDSSTDARHLTVVTVMNLLLVIAYIGMVVTNQEQLDYMNTQQKLMRADHEPNLRCRVRDIDDGIAVCDFRNRDGGIAFNPTLSAQIRSPTGDRLSAECELLSVDPKRGDSERFLEPGDQQRREYRVLLPTEDGIKPIQEAVKSYDDDWDGSFMIRLQYDSSLGETHDHFQQEVSLDTLS